MKKIIVGFVLGILFGSIFSYATFTYKKVVTEYWNGTLNPGERIITVDSNCTMVRVYPASSRMTDVKVGENETLKVSMVIQK